MLAARHPQRCYTNDCAPIIRGILHADGLALSPIQQWSTPEDDRQALTGIMNLRCVLIYRLDSSRTSSTSGKRRFCFIQMIEVRLPIQATRWKALRTQEHTPHASA